MDVLVVPNASRAEVVGLHGDRIKVRVTCPPERMKANAAVLALLGGVLRTKRCQIVAGRTTRHKTILVPRADADDVRNLLL